MRLIDADELIEIIRGTDELLDFQKDECIECINACDTTYDTEEVVKQIEGLFNFRADTQDMLQEIQRCGSMSALVRRDKVIEIVRGVENGKTEKDR